jgi:putative endonuclease
MSRNPCVYILTNKPGGILYIGVTADLPARVAQHRRGEGSVFCRRWGLDRLVYAEAFATMEDAIAREKVLKKWRREWKVALIEGANPEWRELGLVF